ncbi:glycosyltransferase family 2 protein [Granulosicoccus sp.]|nr:glycosyltransferase family 2 protein [Granulosicoccus sp.]
MTIVLGICTYRRPVELRKLLLALPKLKHCNDLTVVVADNDPGHEGLQVCKTLPEDYPFTVTAMSQTSTGISAVRNAVAAKALSFEPEMVAFLDDDEWPEPQWLSELLRVQKQFDADVVGGPTRPEFPPHAHASLHDNPYYGADLNLPDGSACQLQAGGNFLIKASVLQRYTPNFFDEAFSHSGSEDLAFFTRLARDGYAMRWAAQAIVHEPVPDSRLAPDWLQQRVINIHNSRVRVMQQLEPGLAASIIRLVKTAALASVAFVLSLSSLALPAYRQRAELLRWKLTGKLTAHLGKVTTRGETY